VTLRLPWDKKMFGRRESVDRRGLFFYNNPIKLIRAQLSTISLIPGMEAAMKVIKVAVGLVLALALLLSTGGFSQELVPDPQTLWIAVSDDAERWPAVAGGGDHMVIVFVKADRFGIDNIFASVITDDSTTPFYYPISKHDVDCAQPDIAYHASSGLFLVVYTCNQTDVYLRTFSPTTETVGPLELIASGDNARGYPAIACNQAAGSCLVAFNHDHSLVKGAYVDVDSSGINRISPVYDLSDATSAGKPYLVWGKGFGSYLVAYAEQHSIGGVLPSYTHVIDHDDPLVDIKYLHPSTPAVPHGFSPSGYDVLVSDAVFDPCTQTFLISVDYDAAGDGSNFDVWAAVVHPTDPINFTAVPIADSLKSEHDSAISFVAGEAQPPSCGTMDRLLVGYINEEEGLMAVELRGDSSPSSPVYTCDAENQHLLVEYHTPTDRVNAVQILGGAGERRFMMVYQIHHPFSSDDDIWGKIIGRLDKVYLPLVLQ
jgi:hypothetical protein